MTAPAGLLDTTVLIAAETGRPLGALPERVAISVVTLGELQLGVLAATDPETRARIAGIHRTVKLTDALIAACAVERGLPVVTQDDDFDQLARVHQPLDVLRV